MDACTLRAAGAADAEFLLRVYASTRQGELAATGWSAAQLDAFLRQQFAAQDGYYRRHFPQAQFAIVQSEGADAGRLVVDRDDDEIRLLDIALLPQYRRRGLGGAMLRALLAEATASRRRVSLHVECNNPALALYAKMGFVAVQDAGIYRLMHWHPGAADAPRAEMAAEPLAA